MSDLCFKTRMNASVRGLPKVYFCCHPKDFDIFFEDISNEILAKQNCSVWYHGKEDVEYNDEFFNDLSQMNLFVVPVTSRFLKKGNPVLENEFRFAQSHLIPVLPLMQERGLDKKFNELCGDIQYLDKFNNDGTCIQYSDKLEKFLSSVLVGDALAEKIRCAFDAYVFLSYRKKDRYHAQELMKLIHKNEFCRDIAIWYDEFLVPGENFNSAISEALQKSDLFVLAVTPNLVNEANYVMNVEFPMAKESGKPILPCEMVDTDKGLLSEKYSDIPECADEGSGTLSERLRYHFRDIAIGEADSTPEHLYFIGLAYLNGIDVEVDRERALKLIISAAEQKLPEAIKQLVNMYTNGDGVKYNRQKAFEWRKKLLEVNEENYEQEKSYITGFDYMISCFELANAYYEMDLFEDCIMTSLKLEYICDCVINEVAYDEDDACEMKRYAALAEMLLGQAYHAIDDLDAAAEHYRNSKLKLVSYVTKYDNPYADRDLSILYNKMAQLHKVRAEYDEALKHYDWALAIQKENSKKHSDAEHLVVQVLTLCNMSEIYRLIGDIQASKEKVSEALKMVDEIVGVYGLPRHVVLKMVVLMASAENYRLEGSVDKTLAVYSEIEELEQVFVDNYEEIPEIIRAKRLAKMVNVYFMAARYDLVIEYGLKTIEYAESTGALSGQYSTSGGADGASMYLFVGLAYFNGKNDIDAAIWYLKKALEMSEEYIEQGILCNIPELVMAYYCYASCLQVKGYLYDAGEYLEKAKHLYEEHLSGDDSYRNMYTAAGLYMELGKNYMMKDDENALYNALEYLHKARVLLDRIIEATPTVETTLYCDYARLHSLAAVCYDDLGDVDLTKEYYLKCVERYGCASEEKYIFSDWNCLGVACYQLFNYSKGFIETRKWKKRLIDVAHKMKALYPEQYKMGLLYEALGDTEIFD